MDNFVDLKFITDDRQLDRSIKKLGFLEKEVKGLVSAEQKGQITTQQFNKRIATLATELQRASGGSIAARNSVFKFSREVYQSTKAVDRNTKSVVKNTTALNIQNKAFIKTSRAINQYGDRTGLSGKKTNRLGMQLQQTGYQVGDFFVQIQSGTDAMVAFGQQATQLLGVFGTAGALAGAGLAITTALLAPLMRGEREASKLVDRIKELKEEINDLQGKQVMPEEVAASYKLLEDIDVRRLVLNERLLKAQKVAAEFSERGGLMRQNALSEVYRIEQDLVDLEEKREKISSKVLSYQELLAEKKKFIAKQESDRLNQEIARIQTQIEFGEVSKELQKLIAEQTLKSYENELKRLHLHPKVIENLVAQKQIAMELADELGRAAINNQSLASLQFELSAGGQALRNYGSRGARTSSQVALERRNTPNKTKVAGSGGAFRQDPLAKLRERIKLDTELLGKTKERQAVERAIANSSTKYSQKAIDKAVAELEAYNQIVEKRQELQGIYDTAQSSMEDGFMAMVEGTKSVEDAFKDMARSIIKELYQVYVIKRMVGGFGTGGAVGTGILGGVQKILGFDGGGYTGSGPRSGGMDGRGGFLAMMHPRETVVDHTKAGSDVGGEGVTIVQNFNFQANGDDSVKKIIAQSMPAIVNASKQGVMDARRRGGAMKNTFG